MLVNATKPNLHRLGGRRGYRSATVHNASFVGFCHANRCSHPATEKSRAPRQAQWNSMSAVTSRPVPSGISMANGNACAPFPSKCSTRSGWNPASHSAGKSSPNAERPASIDMIAIANANSAVVRWSDMVQLAGVEGEINSLGRDATLRL